MKSKGILLGVACVGIIACAYISSEAAIVNSATTLLVGESPWRHFQNTADRRALQKDASFYSEEVVQIGHTGVESGDFFDLANPHLPPSPVMTGFGVFEGYNGVIVTAHEDGNLRWLSWKSMLELATPVAFQLPAALRSTPAIGFASTGYNDVYVGDEFGDLHRVKYEHWITNAVPTLVDSLDFDEDLGRPPYAPIRGSILVLQDSANDFTEVYCTATDVVSGNSTLFGVRANSRLSSNGEMSTLWFQDLDGDVLGGVALMEKVGETDKLIVATTTTIYAISRFTEGGYNQGEIVWTRDIDTLAHGYCGATPLVFGGEVYISTGGQSAHFVNRYSAPDPVTGEPVGNDWHVQVSGFVPNRPGLSPSALAMNSLGNRIFVNAYDGNLTSIRVSDGFLINSTSTGGDGIPSPIVLSVPSAGQEHAFITGGSGNVIQWSGEAGATAIVLGNVGADVQASMSVGLGQGESTGLRLYVLDVMGDIHRIGKPPVTEGGGGGGGLGGGERP